MTLLSPSLVFVGSSEKLADIINLDTGTKIKYLIIFLY